MRDDLGDLARLDAVVERQLQLLRHLDGLVARDQRRQSDDAAVAVGEPAAAPQLGERPLGVFFEGRRDVADIIEAFNMALACSA
jgi:hypothetical protein